MDPLGNHWVADNPASSSGLTDVDIMSYNYSHGGGAFKIPVKPEYIFQEMSEASVRAFIQGGCWNCIL